MSQRAGSRSRSFAAPRVILLLGWVAVLRSGARAEEASPAPAPLRWKLHEGQTLRQEVAVDTRGTADLGTGVQTCFQELRLTLLWKVKKVESDGAADIEQSCERLRVKISLPGGQKYELDSNTRRKARGVLAEKLDPLLLTLAGAVAAFRLTPAGLVKDFRLPPDVLTALRQAPGGTAMGELYGEDSFRQLVAPFPTVETPAPATGKEYHLEREVKAPFGRLRCVQTFLRRGPETVNGRTLERFDVATRSSLLEGDAKGPRVEIKSGPSEGVAYFSTEEGRFVEIRSKHATSAVMKSDTSLIESVTEVSTHIKLEEVTSPGASLPRKPD